MLIILRDNRGNPQSHIGGKGHSQHDHHDPGLPAHQQKGPDTVVGGIQGQSAGAVGGNYGSSVTPGTGDAARTAGPHDSNTASKSDLTMYEMVKLTMP